jgi:hypothetical protein
MLVLSCPPNGTIAVPSPWNFGTSHWPLSDQPTPPDRVHRRGGDDQDGDTRPRFERIAGGLAGQNDVVDNGGDFYTRKTN